MWSLSDGNKELKLTLPSLVDAAGGEGGVKTTGDHCWERKHLFYIFNKAFPAILSP